MKYLSFLSFSVLAGFLSLLSGTLFYGEKMEPLTAEQPFVVNEYSVKAPETVSDVVAKAQAFKALLTSAQISTLQQTYTSTLAHKWSNLPCGSSCRNGLQFSTLTSAQLTAALAVIQAAASTSGEGYDEFQQIRTADDYLNTSGGGNNYSSGIYFISFLNEPSTTGAWMLQFGGHHYANNMAFNAGHVIGATPIFEGVEPTSFTVNSTAYAPLSTEHDAMANMLASLTSAQLTTAKLSSTFSDVVLGPNQDGNFPATKVGIQVSTLTSAQQALIMAAIQPYTQDTDPTAGSKLYSIYQSELASTYISYTGNGTSGSASTFLNANTNYVRIDGPSVWIEFVCQTGVVFPSQIHYHSVWRDHTRDYGADLTSSPLPLALLNFNVTAQPSSNQIAWKTSNESKMSHFDVERSVDPTATPFSTVATVDAGNLSEVHQYSIADEAVSNLPLVYYRLKMVELDGSASYSQLVSLKRTLRVTTVYPNPSTEQITLSLSNEMTNATLRVINTAGKVVMVKQNVSGSSVKLDVSDLVKGAYLITLDDGRNSCTTKFIR